MSGYLQRLVSSAHAPNAAIRPILGSLYSPPMGESAAQGPLEIEEVEASRTNTAERLPQPTQTMVPSRTPVPTSPEPPRFPNLQVGTRGEGPIPDAQESFRDLVAEVPRSTHGAVNTAPTPAPESNLSGFSPAAFPLADDPLPPTPAEAQSKSAQPAQPSHKHSDRASHEPVFHELIFKDMPQGGEATQHRQTVLPRSDYAPLVAEGIRRLEQEFIQVPPALNPRRSGRITSPYRTTGTKQEPDEIQIHIGRIEVTAIPPAPIRQPAPPVRRSLKLDEYLRRGRGSTS